jgi:DNA-binding Lrp family transcriptional regulator
MAERAFVLINTDYGVDDDILVDQLKKIEGISEAYKIYGIYDILVKIEARCLRLHMACLDGDRNACYYYVKYCT